MEEQNAGITNDGVETIAKKVYDDMDFAHKQTIDKLTQENNLLKKQVNDYSTILKNINVNNQKSTISSSQLIENLIKGVK